MYAEFLDISQDVLVRVRTAAAILLLGDAIGVIASVRLFRFVHFAQCGTNIVASGIFTALSDGKTSALISFLRTFVFIVLSALLLPLVLGTNGVWLSIPVAEFLTLFISVPKLSRYFKDPKVATETQTSPN